MALGDSYFITQHAKLPAHAKKIFTAPTYTPPEIEVEEAEQLTPEQEQEIMKQSLENIRNQRANSRDAQASRERLSNASCTKPYTGIREQYLARARRWNGL